MALKCLKQGTAKGGIYKVGVSSDTYCNHAVYLTIKSVDKNFNNFLGVGTLYTLDEVPWSIDRLVGTFSELHKGYPNKNTNIWCDILKKQSESGILKKLNKEGEQYTEGEKRAQQYANMGELAPRQ